MPSLIQRNNNRIAFIDYAKAFSIFLILLFHTPICPVVVKQWIMSFCIPVFFMLYGLSWKKEKHKEKISLEFLKKRILRLAVPYFFWAVFYLILYRSVSFNSLFKVCYGNQQALKSANSLSTLWFLPCMFSSVVLFELFMPLIMGIEKKSVRITLSILFVSALSFVGFWFDRDGVPSKGCPWGINIALVACTLINLGLLSQRFVYFLEEKRFVVKLAVFLLSFFALTGTFRFNLVFLPIQNVDMASATYGNPFLFFLCACTGYVLIISAAQIIVSFHPSRLMEYIGENTLCIYALHKPIVIKAASHFSGGGAKGMLVAIFISFSTMLLCCGFAWVLNRWLPWTIGNRYKVMDKVSL